MRLITYFAASLILTAGCSSEPEMGVIPFQLSECNADVIVLIDDEPVNIVGVRPAIELSAGKHQLRVEGEKHQTLTREFSVEAGDNELLFVELQPKLRMAEPQNSENRLVVIPVIARC